MNPEKITTVDELKKYLFFQQEQNTKKENKKHEEIMEQYQELKRMIMPVYQAFTLSQNFDKARTDFIMRWSRYIGFALKLSAFLGILWVAFKFGVNEIKK